MTLGVSPPFVSMTISFPWQPTTVGLYFTVDFDLHKGCHIGQSTAGDVIALECVLGVDGRGDGAQRDTQVGTSHLRTSPIAGTGSSHPGGPFYSILSDLQPLQPILTSKLFSGQSSCPPSSKWEKWRSCVPDLTKATNRGSEDTPCCGCALLGH